MAYTPLTTINISLQTAGVTGAGFGTQLFASAHRFTRERVRSYSSLTEVSNDFPTTSNAYLAAQTAFSVTPRPTVFKIGRRAGNQLLTVATGTTAAAFSFNATDGTNTFALAVSVTGQADEDATATAIQTAIEADGDIAPLVTATVSDNVVTIEPVGTNDFWITGLPTSITATSTSTETAADMIAAIDLEDRDWYFLTADDHTQAFVTSAAQTIEAQERMYFMSSQEADALTAYNQSTSTDVLASLAQNEYLRSKGMFYHTADTTFPECRFVAFNSVYAAGSVTWENLQLGLGASRNPTTNNILTTTELSNLANRQAGFIEDVGGVAIIRESGQVANGTNRVSTVRGRDNMSSDLTVALRNLLINQAGSKLSFRDADIGKIRNTVRSVLQVYVGRTFINDNYTMNFPLANQIPLADKQNNVYQSGSFEAELAGEIDTITISGNLVLDLTQ